LSVDGKPYSSYDEEGVQEIVTESIPIGVRGVYYTTFSVTGVEQISLYRTPTVAGSSVRALIVYRPRAVGHLRCLPTSRGAPVDARGRVSRELPAPIAWNGAAALGDRALL
jgi:hypothetical protein